MTLKESPLACDLTAIPSELREGHLKNTERVFRAVEAIQELADGYSFQLPDDSETLAAAAQFIALERLCCPFLSFELNMPAEQEPVSLSLTGREGVKQFILEELKANLPLELMRTPATQP